MTAKLNPQVNTEQIAKRAYEIWVGEGRPTGRATDHWRQAEREVLTTQAQTAASAAGPAPSVVTGAKPPQETTPKSKAAAASGRQVAAR